jgi:hypothetical protein
MLLWYIIVFPHMLFVFLHQNQYHHSVLYIVCFYLLNIYNITTTVKHNELVECLAEYPEFRFSSWLYDRYVNGGVMQRKWSCMTNKAWKLNWIFSFTIWKRHYQNGGLRCVPKQSNTCKMLINVNQASWS